jgi:transposase
VRATTLLRLLLNIIDCVIENDIRVEPGALVVGVRPRRGAARCGECGAKQPGYDTARVRRWRHMNFGEFRVELEYAPRRVRCRPCGGVRVERVAWAEHGSFFTREFEELVAYLAQVTDKSQVTRLAGIAWRSVDAIVTRVVDRKVPEDRFNDLRRIGIDDFSYRKRHRYLTIVVDHDRKRVVWARKGRDSGTLAEFFDELGPERTASIELATIDMAAGYIKTLEERAPGAQIVFDRFHVQRLASDALDEVRRGIMRELGHGDGRRALTRSRFALLKNPWNLNDLEAGRLRDVERANAPLYRAYLLKEGLAGALDYLQPKRATSALKNWLGWASRSRLRPFVRVARTVRRHMDGILAYVKTRSTNGFTEGINNRVRMIARRAFGYHDPQPLISMIFLCCGGIALRPPLPRPTQTS